jgi:hypothetical protein
MVMSTGPDGRKQVNLGALPAWARWSVAIGTVVVVVLLALAFGTPATGPGAVIVVLVAAGIAFALIAWRAQHPRA